MADPIPINVAARLTAVEQAIEDARLKGGGGDDTSGRMEARIARLESDMEHVKKSLDRLADVPVDVAIIKERVSHLPTVGKLWAAAGAIVAALSALVALIIRFVPHA